MMEDAIDEWKRVKSGGWDQMDQKQGNDKRGGRGEEHPWLAHPINLDKHAPVHAHYPADNGGCSKEQNNITDFNFS